ncbi:sugar-binding transcriptional regulator, LacI family [Streptococcus sp. DD10]|uniref:LacI family DNA-binding transcriptional regulator n=1 Tax=Streptococcus sp. DD10 TaxID=1777878 RepID=UPI0007955F19|nr:LacI family DNA-binding transcriptional regulator [Streptococcus sp. DD10]KXT74245.1 sugar-binding transcriptional regulator, LacI family [Streptococcus sp. DD10]
MVNIREIAKKSGYSVSSVSRVLNHHPHVSEEARQKIQAVIDELNYAPNMLARELSHGLTKRVGVIIPHARHPYFTQLINGLLDAAQESDHSLLFLPSNYDPNIELSYLEQLRGHAFDHIIFTSRSLDLETIASYARYGNIVCCEKIAHPDLSSVYVERVEACIAAFKSLQAQGAKRLVLLFSRKNEKSSTYRLVMEAYQAVYGTTNRPLIYDDIYTAEDSYALSKDLIRQDFDAIFANSDDIATGIVTYYEEAGLPLPLIIGQENQLTGKLLGISSMDNKSYQLGRKALAQALSNEPRHLALQARFIEGKT